MKRFHSVSTSLALIACLGMALPGPVFAETTIANPPLALDIALHSDGYLLGQVVSSAGQAHQGAPVILLRNGEEVARAKTDVQGRFAIKGVSGGKYDLATNSGMIAVRAWQPNTAPPKTAPAALLVEGSAVRGQCNCLSGGGHGGAVGVGVGNYQNGAASFNQGGMGYGSVGHGQGCVPSQVVYAPATPVVASPQVVAEHAVAPAPAHAEPVVTGEVHAVPAVTTPAPANMASAPCYSGHSGVGGPYVSDPSATYAGSATGGYAGGCAPGTRPGYSRGVAGGGGGLLGFGMFGGGTIGTAPIIAGAAVAAAIAIPVALDDDDDDDAS